MGEADFIWRAEARTGSRSVCVTNIQANQSADWDSARIAVRPGELYRIGAWAKGDSDRDVFLIAFARDRRGNHLGGQAVTMSYNDSSWTFSERFFTAGADWAWIEIAFSVNNPDDSSSVGSVCFDDVVLEPIHNT